MAKAAGAVTDTALSVGSLARAPGAVRICRDVKDDVIRVSPTSDSLDSLELVKAESISDPPGDHVIGAGCITAYPDATDFEPVLIQRETAAKDVHAAYALADHGIRGRAE